ncbi:MAG: iron ABC transporter permease, partial [Xanthomonadales bacterium]|nr:iron ABC transporter permease [Xanthomonadales bacterium]
ACTPDAGPEDRGDFAVLAQGAEGFAQAQPGVPLVFPRDHGAHPAYRIEWWYLTANLQGSDGLEYGAQWTLFRSATRPPGEQPSANPWQDPQVYMAHLAITTPDDHVAFQRYARGGVHDGQARAGATAQPFEAWLDDWVLRSTGEHWLPLQLRAAEDGYAIDLQLDSSRPKVLQGEDGFSQKHPDGGGSYYYSQPFLEARGDIKFNGQVVAVQGSAWLDREWSSQFLKADQLGWDWFALHLESGEKLMLFRLRGVPGSNRGDFKHGVLIEPSGAKRQLDAETIGFREISRSTVAGRELPLYWRISLGELGRELEVRALHPDQWMDVDFAYWEGVVTVSGEGPGNRGVGYLEMTGYTPR